MIDIKQFAELQKKSKSSFAAQRQLLKKVVAGQTVLCTVCKQPLYLIEPNKDTSTSNQSSGVCCKKGCTDIQLEFV
jgi:hypothetical protein